MPIGERHCLGSKRPAFSNWLTWCAFAMPLAALGCAGTRAGDAAALRPLTPEQQARNVESFDKVWTTIRDKHFDPTLGGLDWNAVRDELRPKVASATTAQDAGDVLEAMITRLDQSHFGIIPASVYADIDAAAATDAGPAAASAPAERPERGGTPGLDVRVTPGGTAVLTSVDADAASQGPRVGMVLVKIDETDVPKLVERIRSQQREKRFEELYVVSALRNRLRGPVGSTVTVALRDASGKDLTVTLNRREPTGKRVQLGYLPPMHLVTETRRIGDDVGYFYLSVFMDPPTVMKEYAEAIRTLRDTRGLIIDLRGNPGGIGAMAMGMTSWLVREKNLQLGVMKTRDMDLRFAVNPRPGAYEGPVAVLVDGLSMSTAEILAAGLQDLGRAKVFGTPTPGAALPSVFERLPNGDGFQYAFANYVRADGTPLEGKGVKPDVVAAPRELAAGADPDPVLEAAVNWIRGQSPEARRPIEANALTAAR